MIRIGKKGDIIMKNRTIIYISFLVLLTAIILSNINDFQNKEYIDGGMQQVSGQQEDDEAVTLFKYLPYDW